MSHASYAIGVPGSWQGSGKVFGGQALRALVAAVIAICRGSRRRASDPLRLYQLNDHMLKDIGLTRAEIHSAAMESFFRE